MIIYKTTNTINNKTYIGQDSHNNPKYFGSGTNLKLAIKKYGKENFTKIILEKCETKEQLNEREIYWIDKLEPDYNITKGGDNGGWNLGKHHSEESKIKMSENRKGKQMGKQNGNYGGNKGSKNPFYNNKHTKESREKMSKTKKEEQWIEKHREQLSKASKGNISWCKGLTKETDERLAKAGEKISKNNKGKPAWNKGKTDIYSVETRKRISEGLKKYYQKKKEQNAPSD